MSALQSIIDEIASQADDFLADANSRNEARAGLVELIQTHYPALPPPVRADIANEVMAILEAEEFFSAAPGEAAGFDPTETAEN